MEKTAKKSQKWRVRAEATRRIADLQPDVRAGKSRLACEQLLGMPELRAARTVLGYAALPDELDLWPALRALRAEGKRVVLPRCVPDVYGLELLEVRDFDRELAPGAYGILEPTDGIPVDLAELDAFAAPGRAFDRRGNRLGRGGGYTDRIVKREGFRAFFCGIGFDCQVFPQVPTEPHDVAVSSLVTESGVIRPRRPAQMP